MSHVSQVVERHLFVNGRAMILKRSTALDTVKQTGLANLQETTRLVVQKTRKPLFFDDEDGPSIRQLRLASQLSKVLDSVFDDYAEKDPRLLVRGIPIEIEDVEVSKDLRHARVHWTLPFTTKELPVGVVRSETRRVQHVLEKKSTKGKIQTLVSAMMRRQYHPRLSFITVDTDLTHSELVIRMPPDSLQ